jgi:hypothetical protein
MAGLGQLFGWARARVTPHPGGNAAPEPADGGAAAAVAEARHAPRVPPLSFAPVAADDAIPPDPVELAYHGARILAERHPAIFPGGVHAARVTTPASGRRAGIPPALRDARRIVMGSVLWNLEGWRSACTAYGQCLAEHGEPEGAESWQEVGTAFWTWLSGRYPPMFALAHGIRFFEMKYFLQTYRDALVRDGLLPADATWDAVPDELAALLACAPFSAVQPADRRALALAGVPFRFDYAEIASSLRERLGIRAVRRAR